MTIKNLTAEQARFPIIGTLHKGAPKPNEKQPGKDLGPYFRFTSDMGDVVRDFAAAYGDQPTQIHVLLPFRTARENFDAWMEEWIAGGLVHRCDGETCVLWYDQAKKKYSTEPKPCPYASGEKQRTDKSPGCRQVGRLSVVIPELGRLAYVTVKTTGKWDVSNLSANLLAYEQLRGDLRGIPFVLFRRKEIKSTPGPEGKRLRRAIWMVGIEPMQDWVRLQIAATQHAALPAIPASTGRALVDGQTGEIISGPDWSDGQPEWDDNEDGEIVENNGNGHAKTEPPPSPPPELEPEDQDIGEPVVTHDGPPPADNAMRLLEVVNQQADYYYKNISHLQRTVAPKGWPRPSEVTVWWELYNKALARARDKRAEQPGMEAA